MRDRSLEQAREVLREYDELRPVVLTALRAEILGVLLANVLERQEVSPATRRGHAIIRRMLRLRELEPATIAAMVDYL